MNARRGLKEVGDLVISLKEDLRKYFGGKRFPRFVHSECQWTGVNAV